MKSGILAGFAATCLVTVNAVALNDDQSTIDWNNEADKTTDITDALAQPGIEPSTEIIAALKKADAAAVEEAAVKIIAEQLGSEEKAREALLKKRNDKKVAYTKKMNQLFNAAGKEEAVTEEADIVEDSISYDLYQLNQQDIADLQAMEQSLVAKEIEIKAQCALMEKEDEESKNQCKLEVDAVEKERKEILYMEKSIKAVMKQQKVDIKEQASQYC